MHPLQQHIISRLIFQGECRYRDLKPKTVDGNLFTYHLKQLFNEELVEKRANIYTLTAKGLHYAGMLSLKNFRPRIQPKIVTIIACHNDKGQWLLYQARRQPFQGLTSFPYGKVHLGETIQEAANRELDEKTQLKAKLTHCGDAYTTIYRDKELISHMFAHIFCGENPTGEPKNPTALGTCFWDKVRPREKEKYTPWFLDTYNLVRKRAQERFFAELTYNFTPTK